VEILAPRAITQEIFTGKIEIIETYNYYQTQVNGIRNKLMGKFSDFLSIPYILHLVQGSDE